MTQPSQPLGSLLSLLAASWQPLEILLLLAYFLASLGSLLPSRWLSLASSIFAKSLKSSALQPALYSSTMLHSWFNPGLSSVSPEDLHYVPVEKPHEAQRVDQNASDSQARLSPYGGAASFYRGMSWL